MQRQPDGPSPTGTQRLADQGWLRAAVRHYERSLIAYAAGLDAARDVVRETFVWLCGADREEIEPRPSQWVFTVTRNGAIDHRRKELVRKARSLKEPGGR